jgi:hypothetical protein
MESLLAMSRQPVTSFVIKKLPAEEKAKQVNARRNSDIETNDGSSTFIRSSTSELYWQQNLETAPQSPAELHQLC